MSNGMTTYLFDLRWTINSEKFSSTEPTHSTSSCNETKNEAEIEPPPPKSRNLGKAVRNLIAQEFLDSKGYISEASVIACLMIKWAPYDLESVIRVLLNSKSTD